jgi:hypothetical protein
VSFTFLAFFSELRQSIVRDGNFAIILVLILGIIAAAFVGYLLWDGILNRVNSYRRRKKRQARRAQHAELSARDSAGKKKTS